MAQSFEQGVFFDPTEFQAETPAPAPRKSSDLATMIRALFPNTATVETEDLLDVIDTDDYYL